MPHIPMDSPATQLKAATLPGHYYELGIFAREQERLFSRTWMYAGLTIDVPKPDDYFLVDIAGKNIIVQNCGGTLKAFINVCSHRHSRIHAACSGNRRLICPYHGWTYDNDGRPIGIRESSNFPQVVANPDAHALRQLELGCVGKFIFLRLQPDPAMSLQDYLGQAWAFLLNVSNAIDRQIDSVEVDFEANWKLAVENTLEGYHLPLVHKATWASLSSFAGKEDEDLVEYLPTSSPHSYLTHKSSAEFLARWEGHTSEVGTWPFRFDHYVHQAIFPCMTITSRMGYSFHVNSFQPVSVDRTRIVSRGYSVRFQGQTETGAQVMEGIYELARRFNRRSWEEDKQVCRMAFLGVQDADRPAVLANALEKRVAHFQRFYLRALSDSVPS